MKLTDLFTSLDIVLLILEQLPINYVWKLRSVCRAWNHILSSDAAERIAFLKHETHDRSMQEPQTAEARKALLMTHLRGLPVGLLYELQCDRSIDFQPVLAGDWLAYVWRDDTVVLVNLPDGARSVYQLKEGIKAMHLSHELLAYTSASRLHVAPFAGQSYSLDIPAGLEITHIACDGLRTVLLGNDEESWCVLLNSGKGLAQMNLRGRLPGQSTQSIAIVLAGSMCHVFRYCGLERAEHRLEVLSLDLRDGQCLQRFIHFEAKELWKSGNASIRVRSSGRANQYHLSLLWDTVSTELIVTSGLQLDAIHMSKSATAIWKDHIYSFDLEDTTVGPALIIDTLEPGTPSQILGLTTFAEHFWVGNHVLINEMYLVLVPDHGDAVVLTFDRSLPSEEIPLHGFDEDYLGPELVRCAPHLRRFKPSIRWRASHATSL